MDIRARLKDAVTRLYDNPEITVTLTGAEALEIGYVLRCRAHDSEPHAQALGRFLREQLKGLQLAP